MVQFGNIIESYIGSAFEYDMMYSSFGIYFLCFFKMFLSQYLRKIVKF